MGVQLPLSVWHCWTWLHAELDKMKAEYEVVVGDWNVRHPEGEPSKAAAGKGDTTVVKRFAQSRGLVEPPKKRLDWDER